MQIKADTNVEAKEGATDNLNSIQSGLSSLVVDLKNYNEKRINYRKNLWEIDHLTRLFLQK